MRRFPELPKVELEVVGDHSAERTGFLRLQRHELVLVGPQGRSAPFRYDVVDRPALDAAIIVPHFVDGAGRRQVYVRSSVRPPVTLRPPVLFHERASIPRDALWEVPAGLIEPGEEPIAAAARELEEELGFRLPTSAFAPLGPPAYPAPGFIGEIHFYFHVEVDPARIAPAPGDGSALEAAALITTVALDDLLALCREGAVPDAKTELAARRLAEAL